MFPSLKFSQLGKGTSAGFGGQKLPDSLRTGHFYLGDERIFLLGFDKLHPHRMRILSWSLQLVALSGFILIVAGISTCKIAGMGSLLPYDVHFLGMTREQLCELHGCRVGFRELGSSGRSDDQRPRGPRLEFG